MTMISEPATGDDEEPISPVATPTPHTAFCSNCGARLHHRVAEGSDPQRRFWMHVDTAKVECWLPGTGEAD